VNHEHMEHEHGEGEGQRTFVVHVEDRPGVLDRVASLFRRRARNIDSLHVGPTHQAGISRMTIECRADESQARRLEANLYKLVPVLRVDDVTHRARVQRVLTLIKVAVGRRERPEVLQLIEVFGARAVDIGPDVMVVEMTGRPSQIARLRSVLEPYGILEYAQTGAVAMTRSKETPELGHERNEKAA
jgi:acetolactate synthase-1/3 small subunit